MHFLWVKGDFVLKMCSRAIVDHVDEEDKTTLVIHQSGTARKSKTSFINQRKKSELDIAPTRSFIYLEEKRYLFKYFLPFRITMPLASDFTRWP